MDIKSITLELNREAQNFRIGKLQDIRKRLKNKSRLPYRYIFNDQTVSDEWAFHYGGRSELQFNIGKENIDGKECLRFGVAFSLEPSRTLPDISVLFPKIKRFNEFTNLYPTEFLDFFTWYWEDSRTPILSESLIRTEYVRPDVFAFFGKYTLWEDYSAREVLHTFDQLLPLYEYVEGDEYVEPLQVLNDHAFEFKPNIFKAIDPTQYKQAEKVINLKFRHYAIQSLLYKRLCSEYGTENVAAESTSGSGTRVDIIVRFNNEYWFYEIKTGDSARSCIREALGQLLEYSFWPGSQEASKLVVVGYPNLDQNAERYLQMIRENFNIPIFYEQQKDG